MEFELRAKADKLMSEQKKRREEALKKLNREREEADRRVNLTLRCNLYSRCFRSLTKPRQRRVKRKLQDEADAKALRLAEQQAREDAARAPAPQICSPVPAPAN